MKRIFALWKQGSFWFATDPVLRNFWSCLWFIDKKPVQTQVESSGVSVVWILAGCIIAFCTAGLACIFLFCCCRGIHCAGRALQKEKNLDAVSPTTMNTLLDNLSDSESIYQRISSDRFPSSKVVL